MTKKYPEEIYTTETGATIISPKKRRMVEKAYNLGKQLGGFTHEDLGKAYDLGYEDGKQAQGDLTGWSNLTAAIKNKRRTADQLEPGTCFSATYTTKGATHKYKYAQLVKRPYDNTPTVFFYHPIYPQVIANTIELESVEIIEEYGVGTFDKPKEGA